MDILLYIVGRIHMPETSLAIYMARVPSWDSVKDRTGAVVAARWKGLDHASWTLSRNNLFGYPAHTMETRKLHLRRRRLLLRTGQRRRPWLPGRSLSLSLQRRRQRVRLPDTMSPPLD